MNFNEKELLIAVSKSISNSEDLISDADLLRGNNRLARAYTLYQLAIEEAGKAMDVYESLLFGTFKSKEGQKILKENFKNHIKKAKNSRLISVFGALQLLKSNKANGEELLLSVFQEMIEAEVINDYKNYSLYTSFINNSYKSPSEVITEQMVTTIEKSARHRVMVIKQLVNISSKQFEKLKADAAEYPITSENSDEEAVKYLKENMSKDFFEKLFSIKEKKSSK